MRLGGLYHTLSTMGFRDAADNENDEPETAASAGSEVAART